MVESNSRFCGECGAQLRLSAAFCGECGHSNVPGLDQSEARPSFDPSIAQPKTKPSIAQPKTKRRTGLFKKLALAAITIGLLVGGIAYYNDMRERYGADFNFDGYITPKEVSNYAGEYWLPWEASGTWRFRPLTMYGSSEMRHVAERLETTMEADNMFMFLLYTELKIGDLDLLPVRADQCLIASYKVSHSSAGMASYNGISGPYNELEVELDCSSQAPRGKRLSARVVITHNDSCMKGFIDYDDETGNYTASSYVEGEFVGYKDDSCLENKNFVNSNISYPQSVWLDFELTRGFADQVNYQNFFIINRNLNAESEDRRRKGEATTRQAESAQESALEASCAAGTAPDEDCAALRDARRDAAAEAARSELVVECALPGNQLTEEQCAAASENVEMPAEEAMPADGAE